MERSDEPVGWIRWLRIMVWHRASRFQLIYPGKGPIDLIDFARLSNHFLGDEFDEPKELADDLPIVSQVQSARMYCFIADDPHAV